MGAALRTFPAKAMNAVGGRSDGPPVPLYMYIRMSACAATHVMYQAAANHSMCFFLCMSLGRYEFLVEMQMAHCFVQLLVICHNMVQ
jgi:hypothetical protein